MSSKLRRIVEDAVRDELSLPLATAMSKLPPHVSQRDFAGEWDTQMFVGNIRPKSGAHYTEATEWVKAIISSPTQSSLGERIARGFVKRGLAHLFLGGNLWQVREAGKGASNQPQHNDSPTVNSEGQVRDLAAAFIRDMWACLWADERLWKLVSSGTPPEQIAEFIIKHYFLILPLASASVWCELAANTRLLKTLVKVLPSHPERLCGWVASNATRNLAGRIRRPEFGRVVARYVSSPNTGNKALAELNYSGPQYLLLAAVLRKMADNALACGEQAEASEQTSFSPPAKRRIPSREQAEKIETLATMVQGAPRETDLALARRYLESMDKKGEDLERMVPSVRLDVATAKRLLKLRNGC